MKICEEEFWRSLDPRKVNFREKWRNCCRRRDTKQREATDELAVIPKRILDQAKANIKKEDMLFKAIRSDIKFVECGGNDIDWQRNRTFFEWA